MTDTSWANAEYNEEDIREYRAMARAKQMRVHVIDAISADPPEFSSLWYRLRAIDQMTKEQMQAMLAFIAGYGEVEWDMAYEQSGAPPIYPVEGDIDYAG
jgi:hypothetical protein